MAASDILIMNGINITLNATQTALLLDLLKPYVELSASISKQYQNQMISSIPVKAKKIDEKPEEK